eukprot:jgi/Ulvmu1/1292/UM011_0016.1
MGCWTPRLKRLVWGRPNRCQRPQSQGIQSQVEPGSTLCTSVICFRLKGCYLCSNGSDRRGSTCFASQAGQALHSPQATLYVAKSPLAGMTSFMRVMFPSEVPNELAHWMLLVHEPNTEACTMVDFLPQKPQAMGTAAQLLMGRSVQGRIRRHQFNSDPPFPRHKLGHLPDTWDDDAAAFCATYDQQLDLVNNDCKAFVEQFDQARQARLDDPPVV